MEGQGTPQVNAFTIHARGGAGACRYTADTRPRTSERIYRLNVLHVNYKDTRHYLASYLNSSLCVCVYVCVGAYEESGTYNLNLKTIYRVTYVHAYAIHSIPYRFSFFPLLFPLLFFFFSSFFISPRFLSRTITHAPPFVLLMGHRHRCSMLANLFLHTVHTFPDSAWPRRVSDCIKLSGPSSIPIVDPFLFTHRLSNEREKYSRSRDVHARRQLRIDDERSINGFSSDFNKFLPPSTRIPFRYCTLIRLLHPFVLLRRIICRFI